MPDSGSTDVAPDHLPDHSYVVPSNATATHPFADQHEIPVSQLFASIVDCPPHEPDASSIVVPEELAARHDVVDPHDTASKLNVVPVDTELHVDPDQTEDCPDPPTVTQKVVVAHETAASGCVAVVATDRQCPASSM